MGSRLYSNSGEKASYVSKACPKSAILTSNAPSTAVLVQVFSPMICLVMNTTGNHTNINFHRHNTQQSAERVSEWRRETCSDSWPQEDPALARLDATTSMSRLNTAAAHSSSALEGGFGRHMGLGSGVERRIGAGVERRILKTTTTTEALEDNVRNTLLVGTRGRRFSSGRPWTTGGYVGGSRPTAPAVATEGLHARVVNGQRNRATAAVAQVEQEVHNRGGQEVWPYPRRRRPQTAKEPGKRRSVPGSYNSETFQTNSNASWQPVWESLQTARLISSPRVIKTNTVAVETTKEGIVRSSKPEGGVVFERKIGGVDFGRQRRARTTARAARGRDVTDYLHESSDSACSAPEEEARSSGGDDSGEAGDRAQIKKRASDLTSVANAPPGVGGFSCSSSARRTFVTPYPSSALTPGGEPAAAAAASTSSRGDDGQIHCITAPQLETFSDNRTVPPPKARRREVKSFLSRRSLAAMDDDTCSSSSEDEGRCLRKSSKPAVPRGKGEQRPGYSEGNSCDDGLGVASVSAGSGGSGGGGGWSSPRRVSSIHASRMLGFDLRKSLAAIDEWTDKATTTSINGGGCGGTPRQRAAKVGEGHQPAPFVIEHTTTTSVLSLVSSPLASNRDVGRAAEPPTPVNGTVHGVVVAETQQTTTIPQKKRHGPSTRTGIQIDDNSDGGGRGDDDDDDEEAVLSVAAARAALGISKVATTADAAGSNPRSRGAPSLAEIDAITGEATDLTGRKGTMIKTTSMDDNQRKQRRNSRKGREGKGSIRRAGSASATTAAMPTTGALPGVAVGMSDEKLKGMLKQQPRTVPELRTKESFRVFFQGMQAKRMDRLLRGAYEESLPADQVDKKVKKRLGLVGDILAW